MSDRGASAGSISIFEEDSDAGQLRQSRVVCWLQQPISCKADQDSRNFKLLMGSIQRLVISAQYASGIARCYRSINNEVLEPVFDECSMSQLTLDECRLPQHPQSLRMRSRSRFRLVNSVESVYTRYTSDSQLLNTLIFTGM